MDFWEVDYNKICLKIFYYPFAFIVLYSSDHSFQLFL